MVGKSKNSASALVKSKPATTEPPVDPDDGPEWTDEMWERAEIRDGDKIIRPGRPPLDEAIKKKPNSSSASPAGEPWNGPELTDELLERFAETAEIRHGDKVVRRGRPLLGDSTKGIVTIRLDADVLEAYRALGAGWQAQVNADLRRARKLGSKVKKAV